MDKPSAQVGMVSGCLLFLMSLVHRTRDFGQTAAPLLPLLHTLRVKTPRSLLVQPTSRRNSGTLCGVHGEVCKLLLCHSAENQRNCV